MIEHIMQKNITVPSHDFIEALQHPLLLEHSMESNELKVRKMTRNNLTLCTLTDKILFKSLLFLYILIKS